MVHERIVKVGIYTRVSTKKQTAYQQIKELKRFCRERNFKVIRIFVDEGVSGKLKSRPEFDEMLKYINTNRINTVLVHKFDRFARTMSQLVSSLEDFRERNIDFISYTENVDTTTASGRAMFGMIAVFAQFEREMKSESTKERLELCAKAGIPLGRSEIKFDIHKAWRLRQQGVGWRTIAEVLGGKVSYITIRRVLQKALSLGGGVEGLQLVVNNRKKRRVARRKHKKRKEMKSH